MRNPFVFAMKEKLRRLEGAAAAILTLCVCLGWWGVLYPQLSLTPDTYRIVREDGTVQEGEEVVKWDFEGSAYMEILNADREKVRFRSALWERISEFLEDWKKE